MKVLSIVLKSLNLIKVQLNISDKFSRYQFKCVGSDIGYSIITNE